jgi:hypothetical protein
LQRIDIIASNACELTTAGFNDHEMHRLGRPNASLGQHYWLEEHRRQSHLKKIGAVGPTPW